MEQSFAVVSAYQDNESLRKSFNELACRTFGIDFEDWYQNGYWKENYCPYSIVSEGKIIANVSVSRMEFDTAAGRKTYIQLGTVMTDPDFRRKGLIRRLMGEIEKDWDGKTDGYYLFANDSVLDFYPRFGYRRAVEFQYSRPVSSSREQTAEPVSMETKADWDAFEKAVAASTANSAIEMRNNPGLVMFYLTKFMRNDVYYIRRKDAYAVAQKEGDTLFLHQIFAKNIVSPQDIGVCFGSDVRRLVLGFTPLEKDGFVKEEVHTDDTTLFIKDTGFEELLRIEGMFPVMSHT